VVPEGDREGNAEMARDSALPGQTAVPMRERIAGWLGGESLLALIFILPSLAGFIVFFAVPAVRGVTISFTDWNLLTAPNSVGLKNYERLLQDEEFWHALKVTVQYVLWNIPAQTVLALVMAVLMDRSIRSTWFRGVVILPWLLPNVVVALLWLWMLDPTLGIVNEFLATVGISRQPFLGSIEQAIPAIALINVWRHAGYVAVLIFAGLKTIPQTLYEVAAIDGASELRIFRSITLPLLRPVLAFVLITNVIGSFQIFDTIAVTTEGGLGNASRVIYWYIYEYAFERFNMGYSTTIASALFLILIAITTFQMRYWRAGTAELAEFGG
jgi:multiple sugar transport system permease protein